MLKTNSKKARENMRSHVLECCIEWHERDGDEYTGDKPVTEVWEWMRKTHSWEFAQGGRRAVLRHDLQGLGLGDFLFARDVLKDVLEETDEEADSYTNIQAEELYMNLFERHFFELVEKETA
jgi:hypothetical protein